MDAARRQRLSLIGFCTLGLSLYIYGVVSAPYIPSHIEDIILPLDFMVGIPLGFYLFVIRPRRLSLLSVIPVIWIGYGLSIFALGSADAGVLPYLLVVLIPAELTIAFRECLKVTQVYKSAKKASADPMAWFKETMLYLVRKDAPASMAAAELGVWYYSLLSWRKKPYVLPGEAAFSYHNAGGYMSMMFGLALAFPVEIVGVHILVSQWSVIAACAVTALSVYAAIWLIGDARARVMRPVAIGNGYVRLGCGIQMEAVIPLSEIEKVCVTERDACDLPKEDALNFGTFYKANLWIITKCPVLARTITGTKQVRAIGISIDDPKAMIREIQK
ncbi:hypothetical protein [Parvibacter caecicola]|uniref:Uncharacterized protein n=1 Tax=Parvibacter caecicola TaxID=747645 RepID=A0A4T9T8T7_9ACTN|nr:hypothetical protein [Parvibacter caecicola]TJW11478.1 hypothetical protein E5982_04565 [Parvibacter caecicola]